TGSFLSNYQAPRCRHEDHRDQALLFHLQRRVAHDTQMRTGVVDQDYAVGIDLRKKTAHFLFPDGDVAVAEKNVDLAVHFHFEARLIPQVDVVGDSGTVHAFSGNGEHFGIVLATDDPTEAVDLQPLCEPDRADPAE